MFFYIYGATSIAPRTHVRCTIKHSTLMFVLTVSCLRFARSRKFDIMDSMVQKLEKYADNLESIVEQRTAELFEEKQKTDMLLNRMLPP